jgi:F0F1-type ATP synthase assembly protein I
MVLQNECDVTKVDTPSVPNNLSVLIGTEILRSIKEEGSMVEVLLGSSIPTLPHCMHAYIYLYQAIAFY